MDPTSLPTGLDWRANISTRFWARLVDGLLLAVPSVALIVVVGDVEAGAVASLTSPLFSVGSGGLACVVCAGSWSPPSRIWRDTTSRRRWRLDERKL